MTAEFFLVGDGLVELRNNVHSSPMSVIQFVPVDFNGRVELFIVFKQFLKAGITLGFGEVKYLMKEVQQVDNADWEFIWGDINKFFDTVKGV